MLRFKKISRAAGESPMADETNRLYLCQAQLGPMANFVYFIADKQTHKAAVVDPAWEVDKIIAFAENEGYTIDKLLITHYHPDHLGGSMMGQNIQGAAEILKR